MARASRRNAAICIVLTCAVGMGATIPGTQGATTCSVPPASHIAYWTATLDATDAFGCHHGTLASGAAFGAGRVGAAFSFDGVDDHVAVADHPLWTLGSADFAISFWFNLATPCDPCVFLGADEGGGPQDKWIVYLSSGKLVLHVNWDGAPSGLDVVSGEFSPATAEWYQVAVTRVGDLFTLWVNGLPLAAQTSAIFIPDPSAGLTIGQAEGIGHVHGLMDEIEVVRSP